MLEYGNQERRKTDEEKNVDGGNMSRTMESDEKAEQMQNQIKAGTKINKESDAKKSKKFRKEFLSQKQKDTAFLCN